jgi:hypothetical protein
MRWEALAKDGSIPRRFNQDKQFAQFASPEPWALQAVRAWTAVGTRRGTKLLRRLQRVLALLEELVLESQTFLVGLDGANRLHDGVDPRLCLELAELA